MKIEDKYNLMCINALKEKFEISNGLYKDPDFIENSLKLCRDIIIDRFEKEASRICSFNLVCQMLADYSITSVNKPSISDEKIKHTIYVLRRKQYKYLFGEITKLSLHDDRSSSLNHSLQIDFLYLANLLHMISQNLYLFYMNNNSGMQLNISDNSFKYSFFDTSFEEKRKYIMTLTSYDFFTGKIGGQELVDNFLDVIEDAFGEVVNHFREIVFEDNTPIFIENPTFAEFTKNINQQYEIQQRQPYDVVDITGLYINFPNNPFLSGLTLKKEKINLSKNLTHPHKSHRSRYRPVIELTIDGYKRYITTPYLVFEALSEHITNQIPFRILPDEWKQNSIITRYSSSQHNEHDKWLEDLVEKKLNETKFMFLRNKKVIDKVNLEKAPSSITGINVGEIDFIIIDINQKRINVVECKHMKTQSDFANLYNTTPN